MKMQAIDSFGSLYSAAGLRFGGFQTEQFFEATEELENIRSGVREEIIAEAHCLVYWLHSGMSTILCKFDKGANWAAPFLSELISNSTPFLTI